MKKKFVAILLVLIILSLGALLLLTMIPLTLTGCLLNTYHARFDSEVEYYLDFDYVESLESFGTTGRGDVYLIDDESVFEKALPEYDSSVDFDKKIAILLVYKTSSIDEYRLRSIKLNDGVLTVKVSGNIEPPGYLSAVEPYLRGFLLTIDRISFDSVEFVDVRWGKHPR